MTFFFFVSLVLYSSFVAGIKASVLLPFGETEGDQTLPPGDSTSSLIRLPQNIVYFEKSFNELFVNKNGVIWLKRPADHPQEFASRLLGEEITAVIAPFYVETQAGGGAIYHRTVDRVDQNDYLFRRLERIVYAAFFDELYDNYDFEADFMFIATWDSVSNSVEGARANQANTFQVVLLSDGVESYAIFNYGDINWSIGLFPSTGHKGVASIGFNPGDGSRRDFLHEASGGDDVLHVDERSNVGIPGRWIYKIDGFNISGQTEDVTVRCMDGWTYFDVEFACYKFIPDRLNWTMASNRCRDDGGVESHLAAITTPEKNAFISREITRGVKTWIGGSQDPPNEREWKWVTGEPWVYTNWRQREPNNWGDEEHCLNTNFVRPGLWNDHFCRNKKASICEMFPIVSNYKPGGDV